MTMKTIYNLNDKNLTIIILTFIHRSKYV